MNISNIDIKESKKELGVKAAEIISSDLNIKRWDKTSLKGCCPFHDEKTPSLVWNKEKNYFKCFGCGETYDIVDHFLEHDGLSFIEATEKLFKLVGRNYDFESYRLTDKNKKNKNKEPYKFPVEEKKELDTVIEYLHIRGFSDETIKYSEIKSDGKGNISYEYKNEKGTLLAVKYRPGRKVTKKDNKCWFQKNKDTSPVLWGMEKIDTTKPLIITEGEMDRLSVIESGYKNTVSVPLGANNYHWIEYNYDWLEKFDKIIIWADNDEAGKKMISEVVPRLGEYRCYVVKSTLKDANLVLFKEGKEAVRKCIDNAKDIPIKNILDMADVEDFDINEVEKIKTGYKVLDKYIAGFVMPSIDIITGINSSGKSTLINQMCICEPLEQGYKTFIFSGELQARQLRSWIEFPMAGNNTRAKNYVKDAPTQYYIPSEIKDKMREWYRGKIFFYDNEDDYSAKSLLKKMEEMAKKYGVKNFIIDNLMMVDLECNTNELNKKQKEFVLDLKRFSKKFKCVVHLIAHPRKLDIIKRLSKLDVSGSGDITNLADYVLSVHRVSDKEKESSEVKGEIIPGCPFDCILDLFKNRPLGYQDKEIGLHFDMKSKRFYGDSDDVNKKMGWENINIEFKSEKVNNDIDPLKDDDLPY